MAGGGAGGSEGGGYEAYAWYIVRVCSWKKVEWRVRVGGGREKVGGRREVALGGLGRNGGGRRRSRRRSVVA